MKLANNLFAYIFLFIPLLANANNCDVDDIDPVCVDFNGLNVVYINACYAECAGYNNTQYYYGVCIDDGNDIFVVTEGDGSTTLFDVSVVGDCIDPAIMVTGQGAELDLNTGVVTYNCITTFDPVCGCDGITYENACIAEARGVKYYTQGSCNLFSGSCEKNLDPQLNCSSFSYNPVCVTCENLTFANSCEAEAAGFLSSEYISGDCGSAFWCNLGEAEFLECGDVVYGTLSSSDGNDISSYNCTGNSYPGYDKVYAIQKRSAGDLQIGMEIDYNNPDSGIEMGLLLLDGNCNSINCIDTDDFNDQINGSTNNNEGVSIKNLSPGIYYLVVDSRSSSAVGDFRIEIGCSELSCYDATEITVGQTLLNQTNANGSDDVISYDFGSSSNVDNNGNEVVYEFVLTQTQDVEVRIFDLEVPMAVMLLDRCDRETGLTFDQNELDDNGNPETCDLYINETLTSGKYYIVVDGYYGSGNSTTGAVGNFSIAVYNPPYDAIVLDDIFEVSCTSSANGNYDAATASFGAQCDYCAIGELVYVDNGGINSGACATISDDLTDKIAVIDRGDCFFSEKVEHAEEAGAVAAIICNDDPTGLDNMPPPTSGSVATIPSVMLSMTDCNTIKAAIAECGASAKLGDGTCTVPTDCTSSSTHPDYNALMDLYNSTNGDDWINTVNGDRPWDQSCDPCDGSWYGVQCSSISQRVDGIDISQNNLTGQLPSELNFPFAISLNFADNSLVGEIPNLSSLTSLWVFNCYNNNLTGLVPDLSNLVDLLGFSCHSNNLNGPIPSFSNNISLELFSGGDNQFSGAIPSLDQVPNLEYFYCGNNSLTGELPSLDQVPNLLYFYCDNNNLIGELPSLDQVPNLRRFYVHENNLNGCYNESLNLLCSLEYNSDPDQFSLDGYNLDNNPQLPWQGDLTTYCNGEDQIGAPCDDGDDTTTNDAIQADCSCAGESNPNMDDNCRYYLWENNYGSGGVEYSSDLLLTADGGYMITGTTDQATDDVNGIYGNTDIWLVKTDDEGVIEWTQNYGGNQYENAITTVQLADGSFILGGTTSSQSDNVSSNNGGSDFWVVNIDQSGTILWEKTYGGAFDDRMGDLILTSDGGLVIGGSSFSITNGHLDYLVYKLDNQGNIEWSNNYGGSQLESLQSIVETNEGGYLLGGASLSNDLDISNNFGSRDWWVVKTDIAGNIEWERNYGGSGDDWFNTALTASDGGYLLAGSSESTTDDVGSNNGASGLDYWIVKIDISGNIVWSNNYGGDGIDQVYGASPALDGGYLISGATNSVTIDVESNFGSVDGWLVKLDVNGGLVWQKNLGGSGWDVLVTTEEISMGNFATAHYSSSSNNQVSNNYGSQDIWVGLLTEDIHPDYNALMDLYNSTNGDNWTNTVNGDRPWDQSCDPCDGTWYGVSCDFNRVTWIELNNNNLSGEINSINEFQDLITFDCSFNNITGQVPSIQLDNLVYLILNDNLFEGSIPSLTNVPNLRLLECSNNNLLGRLPTLNSVPNFHTLGASNNFLTGEIPDLTEVPFLEAFFINDNNLSGCFLPSLNTLCNLFDPDDPLNMANSSGFNLRNNPLLPWQGDLTAYCNGEDQIGAPCDDDDDTTTNDVIQADCSCRGEEEEFRPFITTWKTDNFGVSCNRCITIPTNSNYTYNYDVDWDNDGVFDTLGITEDFKYTFDLEGVYQVAIRGQFPAIWFYDNVGTSLKDASKLVDVSQWGDITWHSFDYAFYNCNNLNLSATDDLNLSNVVNTNYMFYNCQSLNAQISHWDVSSVENMDDMFRLCRSFNADLDDWDVSNVNSMSSMFQDCDVFDRDLTNWNVGNVTNMESLFKGCNVFNGDISNWNVSNVNDMSSMFSQAVLFNRDISNWTVSSVTNMRQMFFSATSFASDLSQWDVSSVTNLFATFQACSAFDSDLSGWNVDEVVNMEKLFSGCSSFNSDIRGWNVSNATTMKDMFRNANSFDVNLGSWDLTNLENAENMFSFMGMSQQNYEVTLNGWGNNPNTPNTIVLGSDELQYCDELGRNTLVNDKGWTITGDIKISESEPCDDGDCTNGIETWNTETCECQSNPVMEVLGCTDTSYCEYDPLATCDDGTCQTLNTDPGTCNADCAQGDLEIWNSDSCLCESTGETIVQGCTDTSYCEYDPLATCDDGSCLTLNTDPGTCNTDCTQGDLEIWNPTTCLCETTEGSFIQGCTDTSYCEYDPLATCDDGSCLTLNSDPGTCNTDCTQGDLEVWNSITCECDPATAVVNGCTDSTACNYDPTANCDDGSCLPVPVCNMDICLGDTEVIDPNDPCTCITDEVQVLGCTDGLACNFSSAANCDDGTCQFDTTSEYVASLCEGDVITIPNVGTYSSATNESITLSGFASNGCDSIVQVIITVDELIMVDRQVPVCEGEAYSYYGQDYFLGLHEVSVPALSEQSCDSLISLTVTEYPMITTTFDTLLCPGDSYTYQGERLDATNPLMDFISFDENGCESILTVMVEYDLDVESDCSDIEFDETSSELVVTPTEGTNFPIDEMTDNLSIYGRWGNRVFYLENPSVDFMWNGTHDNGEMLPEGTYFYFVEQIGDGNNPSRKRGFITLIN